ncbi:MAG: PolC-type DNA polymerase III [Oscillospiraceae bacterium]|nr:PolC-type DNA polymerase III [Oscillospiraceae bacterium]
MDNRLYSLEEIINGIETVGAGGGGGRRGASVPAPNVDFGKMYVAGADFYAADRKLLLKIYSDAAPGAEHERRARLMLAEIFGCADVELQISGECVQAQREDGQEHREDEQEHREDAQEHRVDATIEQAERTGGRDARAPREEDATTAEPTEQTGGRDARAPREADAAATEPAPAKRSRASASTSARGSRYYSKASREKVRAGYFDSSMKGVDYEDGAYFERYPDVICGVPITAPPVSISQRPVEQMERAVLQGEVVTLGYRPIRKGDMEIMDCGISDGTGSILVKLIVPAKKTSYIKPKINKGDDIIVYGEIQNDTYLKEQILNAVDINKRLRAPRVDDAAVKRVELHLHTQMSALDAVSPVEELIKRAAEFGHPAVAITDHGVVQAYPDAYDAGKKHGIKIIYGVEAYLAPGEIAELNASRGAGSKAPKSAEAKAQKKSDANTSKSAEAIALKGSEAQNQGSYHIIILAKNQKGLKNLYKLISKSHLEYFYRRPLMPRDEIEAHREGLIVGSACESGELFTAIKEKRGYDELLRIASFYDYLEIQPLGNNQFLLNDGAVGSMDDLRAINETIIKIGDELGKPVAATCDVHFLDESDEQFRRILMSGQGYKDAESQPPLFLRTTGEMLGEFEYLGADKAYDVVVDSTNRINGWIDEGIKPIPDGMFTPAMEGADDELKELTEKSAAEKYGSPLPAPIRERLDQELDILVSKNFSVMYMIARKLVKKSNEDGYMVGSRGSVGSSLVATLIGVTDVNPLPPHYLCGKCKYLEFSADKQISSGFDLPDKLCPHCGDELAQDGQDIMFEIFIGAKGLEKAPDIDLNFSGDYQPIAHKYTEELFGEANVFKAGTIGTIANKTAYGFVKKYLEANGLAPGKIEEDRLTAGCTGVKRNTGQHPGGLIVVPHDMEIYDFTPIQHPADAADKNIVTTHFDFNALKETILKLDLLGHADPSIVKMLEELTGVKASGIKMNDPHIMSLFTGTAALGVAPEDIGSPVGTIGLPEFGTRFIRQMLVETQPRTFSDLLQISGLSHGTNVWLNNAQELIRKGVCTVSEVIGTRESLVLYLMNHGLDQTTAFEIMEAVRKKGGKVSEENEQKMLASGVPEWYIDSCNKIEYLFTKGHATAYVQMAYHQAWYKIYKPLAFYAAYFTVRAEEFDAHTMTRGADKVKMRLAELNKLGRDISPREQKIQTILEVVIEMYARGIDFLPVDIYRSDTDKFLIEDGAIRPPLCSLTGLGASAAQGICAARGGKPFISIDDMAARSKATKTVVEILRGYGALEGMPDESQISLYELLA